MTKALALVVALLLDPDAETGPEPTAGVPSDALREQHERDQGEERRAPEDEAAPLAPRSQRRPAREHPRRHPQPHRPVELSAGAELGVIGAVGPDLAPKAQAFIDVALTQRARNNPPVVAFAPALRLGVGGAVTSSDLPIGSQAYWWAGAVARLCPVRVGLPGALGLRPCGAMQVGAHHGSTDGVPNGANSTDLWLAPEAGATLEWELTSSVALDVYGGAVFPLVRTRFFLAPDTTIFSVPAVAGTGSIAARVRFW